MLWNPDVLWDIRPATNTNYDIANKDSAYVENSVAGCVIPDPVNAGQTKAQTAAGDWV